MLVDLKEVVGNEGTHASSIGAPMSVQQAYAEMIGTEDLTLERYQVRLTHKSYSRGGKLTFFPWIVLRISEKARIYRYSSSSTLGRAIIPPPPSIRSTITHTGRSNSLPQSSPCANMDVDLHVHPYTRRCHRRLDMVGEEVRKGRHCRRESPCERGSATAQVQPTMGENLGVC